MITSHCSTNIEIPKNVNDLQKQNDYLDSNEQLLSIDQNGIFYLNKKEKKFLTKF